MAREPLLAVNKPANPKIVVAGQSVTTGRMPTLLRIRPTLVKRVREQSVGPLYLIIEHALERLLDEVAKPNAKVVHVPGYAMSPTTEDVEMLKSARATRAALDENESKGPTAKSVKAAADAKRATPAKKAPAKKRAAKAA